MFVCALLAYVVALFFVFCFYLVLLVPSMFYLCLGNLIMLLVVFKLAFLCNKSCSTLLYHICGYSWNTLIENCLCCLTIGYLGETLLYCSLNSYLCVSFLAPPYYCHTSFMREFFVNYTPLPCLENFLND